jgi:hypothetical protein
LFNDAAERELMGVHLGNVGQTRGGLGGSVMKAVAVFFLVLAMVVRTATVNAQSIGDCASVVQSIESGASAISDAASSYWALRVNFVDLTFGSSSRTVAAAPQVAEQTKTQADGDKAGMPAKLASFKGLIATARSQNCLSPAQLSAIVEPTIKQAKRVNFDQLPQEEHPLESTFDRGPPEMPIK